MSFNAPIGPRRALACASVSLGDMKDLKKHFDVKLNDVVLELTVSAVRRYLSRARSSRRSHWRSRSRCRRAPKETRRSAIK